MSPVPTEVSLSPPEDPYNEEVFPKDITKWNSNDLMDKMENPEPEDPQGNQPGGEGVAYSCLTQFSHNEGLQYSWARALFCLPGVHNTSS